jgi:hypothetical protein
MKDVQDQTHTRVKTIKPSNNNNIGQIGDINNNYINIIDSKSDVATNVLADDKIKKALAKCGGYVYKDTIGKGGFGVVYLCNRVNETSGS